MLNKVNVRMIVCSVLVAGLFVCAAVWYKRNNSYLEYTRVDYQDLLQTEGDPGEEDESYDVNDYVFSRYYSDDEDVVHDDDLFYVSYPKQMIGSVTVNVEAFSDVTFDNFSIEFKVTDNEGNISISKSELAMLVGYRETKIRFECEDFAKIEVTDISFEGWKDGTPEYVEVDNSSTVRLYGQNSIVSKMSGTVAVVNKYGYVTDVVEVKKGKPVVVSYGCTGVYLKED